MGRAYSSVRSTAALLLLCLLLAGCGGDGNQPRELLVFGVAPDYDEIAEEIVAASPDQGELQRLTRGVPGYAYSPVVSPDGRHIAFSVSESLTPPESSAWVMAQDGTKRRRLAPRRDGYSYATGWSPDGKWVLYSLAKSRRDGELVDRGLWTADVSGDRKRRLMAKGAWGEAAWSPDGGAIAVVAGAGTSASALYLYDLDVRRSRVLVRDASLPRWTPDSRRLLFKRTFQGKRSGFYVIDRDEGAPRLLEPFGAEDDPWLGEVSPDGKWVLVGYHPSISKISLADGEVRRLTSGQSDWAPAWSPDGERIAFERDGDIWVMDADGGDARVVARAPRARVYTRPHWLSQER